MATAAVSSDIKDVKSNPTDIKLHTIQWPSTEVTQKVAMEMIDTMTDSVKSWDSKGAPALYQFIVDFQKKLDGYKKTMEPIHTYKPPTKLEWTEDELTALGAVNIEGEIDGENYHASADSKDGEYHINIRGEIPHHYMKKFYVKGGWEDWFYENEPHVELNGVEIAVKEHQHNDAD